MEEKIEQIKKKNSLGKNIVGIIIVAFILFILFIAVCIVIHVIAGFIPSLVGNAESFSAGAEQGFLKQFIGGLMR